MSWRAVAVCGESRTHGGNGGDGETGCRYRALFLPTWHTSARRATRAAQRLENALKASEPRSSNLQGYTDPVRSAKLPTGVNKIMTRFGLVHVGCRTVLLSSGKFPFELGVAD